MSNFELVCVICGEHFPSISRKRNTCSEGCKKKRKAQAIKRYQATDRGKNAAERHRGTTKFKKTRQVYQKQYEETAEGQARKVKHRSSQKYKDTRKEYTKSGKQAKAIEKYFTTIKVNDPQVIAILELYATGAGRLQVSRKLGISEGTVRNVLNAFKVTRSDAIRKKGISATGKPYEAGVSNRKKIHNFTDAEQKIIFDRDKGICQYCNKPIQPNENWCIHHIIPVHVDELKSRGLDNGQLLHQSCHWGNFWELHFDPEVLETG